MREVLKEWLLLGILALLVSLLLAYRHGPLLGENPWVATWSMVEGQPYLLIDLRSPSDFQESHLAGAVSLPTADLETGRASLHRLDRSKDWVVYTRRGAYEQATEPARQLGRFGHRSVGILLDPPL